MTRKHWCKSTEFYFQECQRLQNALLRAQNERVKLLMDEAEKAVYGEQEGFLVHVQDTIPRFVVASDWDVSDGWVRFKQGEGAQVHAIRQELVREVVPQTRKATSKQEEGVEHRA